MGPTIGLFVEYGELTSLTAAGVLTPESLRPAGPSPDAGIAAPGLSRGALLGAGGRREHLELFFGRHVIGLVGNHVDESAARTLLGLRHQLFQLLLAALPVLVLRRELIAAVIVVLAGIGKNREPAVAC